MSKYNHRDINLNFLSTIIEKSNAKTGDTLYLILRIIHGKSYYLDYAHTKEEANILAVDKYDAPIHPHGTDVVEIKLLEPNI